MDSESPCFSARRLYLLRGRRLDRRLSVWVTIIRALNIFYVTVCQREKTDRRHRGKAGIKERCIHSRGATHFLIEFNSTLPTANRVMTVSTGWQYIQSRGLGIVMKGVLKLTELNFLFVISCWSYKSRNSTLYKGVWDYSILDFWHFWQE